MANKLWSSVQKGTYAGVTAYTVGDFVDYNGASYTCILNSTGNLPTDTTYWALVASKGDTGATGATGATGSTGATGATGATGTSFTWLGAYNAGTSYVVNDNVSYNGSSYICILASTGNLPTNATYWSLLALKGTDGAGSGDMLATTYDPATIAEQVVGLTATQTLTNKTLTAPVINSPTGIVKGDVGLGSVDNTADTAKPVSTAQQTALDLKAPLVSPTFTTSMTGSYLTASEILITDGSKNIVSAPVATYPSLTELAYAKGVTSAIQTQIDTKGTMSNLSEDITPQLGGDLDAQANHIGFTQQTITYGATTTTVDWGAGNKATVTLTGNVGTMAFTNPPKPSNVVLKIVQDATGSRVVTAWDADIKWAGGTAPTLTTTANGIDIVSFYFDGTNYYGVASLAFA